MTLEYRMQKSRFCMNNTWFIWFKKICVRPNTFICTDQCLSMDPYKTCRSETVQTENPRSSRGQVCRVQMTELEFCTSGGSESNTGPKSCSWCCILSVWLSPDSLLDVLIPVYEKWLQLWVTQDDKNIVSELTSWQAQTSWSCLGFLCC